jgi:hypothetical protein
MGGTVFLTSLGLSLQLKDSNLYLGFSILCVGFFITGIGISIIGPLFFGYASARSDKPQSSLNIYWKRCDFCSRWSSDLADRDGYSWGDVDSRGLLCGGCESTT